jgi:hypothetical protein
MDDSKQMWANGGLIAAASFMFILGVFHFFSGIAAFFRNSFYVVGTNYPYAINNHAWGWIHVIGGVILAAAGLALFSGRAWARGLAIALVVLSAVGNFFFIPYYPLWALTMLALDVFVIWAIASANTSIRTQGMAGQTGAMDTSRASMGGSAYAGPNDNQPQYARAGQRWPENAQQDATGRHWAGDAKEGTGARPVDAGSMQGQNSQPGSNMGGTGDRKEQYAGRASGQAGSMSEDVTARARQQAEDAARKGGNS